MREAYRLNKQILTPDSENSNTPHFLIAFNYMDKEMRDYPTIEKAVRKALRKIIEN